MIFLLEINSSKIVLLLLLLSSIIFPLLTDVDLVVAAGQINLTTRHIYLYLFIYIEVVYSGKCNNLKAKLRKERGKRKF